MNEIQGYTETEIMEMLKYDLDGIHNIIHFYFRCNPDNNRLQKMAKKQKLSTLKLDEIHKIIRICFISFSDGTHSFRHTFENKEITDIFYMTSMKITKSFRLVLVPSDEIPEFLIENGADVNLVDKLDRLPLFLASNGLIHIIDTVLMPG